MRNGLGFYEGGFRGDSLEGKTGVIFYFALCSTRHGVCLGGFVYWLGIFLMAIGTSLLRTPLFHSDRVVFVIFGDLELVGVGLLF